MAVLGVGCGRKAPPREEKTVEVVVTTPITDEVVDYQDFTGRLDARKTVDIRPRVSGYVLDGPLQGRRPGQEGRLAVPDRPAVLPGRLGPGGGQRQPGRSRTATSRRRSPPGPGNVGNRHASRREEYDQPSPPARSPRRPSEAMDGRPRPGQDLPGVHEGPRPARRPHQPARGRSGQPRQGRQHHADDHRRRTTRSTPTSTWTSAPTSTSSARSCPASPAPRSPSCKFPVLMRLANEDEFTQRGRGGLRRQPARRQHRHDPHARRLREPARHAQVGPVRPHPPADRPALQGAR